MRPREVTFVLEKVEEICWERLLSTSQKQPWLRVDFKNWKDEDNSDSDSEDNPIIGTYFNMDFLYLNIFLLRKTTGRIKHVLK